METLLSNYIHVIHVVGFKGKVQGLAFKVLGVAKGLKVRTLNIAPADCSKLGRKEKLKNGTVAVSPVELIRQPQWGRSRFLRLGMEAYIRDNGACESHVLLLVI